MFYLRIPFDLSNITGTVILAKPIDQQNSLCNFPEWLSVPLTSGGEVMGALPFGAGKNSLSGAAFPT